MDDSQLIQESLRSYTQEIQSFAFADIQAFQVRRTVRGMVYNIVLALLLTALVSALNGEDSSYGGRVAVFMACGFFALLLLTNIARGPTCRTVLLTALGPQRLFSLSRTRQARRALDTIIAGVAAVQGALPPGEAARQIDQAQAQRSPLGGSPPGSRPETTLPGSLL